MRKQEESGSGVEFMGCAFCLKEGINRFWRRHGGTRVPEKNCVCKRTALVGMCTDCLEEHLKAA